MKLLNSKRKHSRVSQNECHQSNWIIFKLKWMPWMRHVIYHSADSSNGIECVCSIMVWFTHRNRVLMGVSSVRFDTILFRLSNLLKKSVCVCVCASKSGLFLAKSNSCTHVHTHKNWDSVENHQQCPLIVWFIFYCHEKACVFNLCRAASQIRTFQIGVYHCSMQLPMRKWKWKWIIKMALQVC